MPTPSSTASFTTPTASTSPATASDADAPPDRAQRIDHQPATLTKIYCQQGARQPGDIISDRRATSSRNQWATSSESAHGQPATGPEQTIPVAPLPFAGGWSCTERERLLRKCGQRYA